MVKAIVGPKGSGKTKRQVQCITDAVKEETGALVCIEKGGKLKFDINYQVRLIDARDYTESGYAFLRGMICGLHAGNFDIAHIFIDNLLKIVGDDVDLDETAAFLQWCEDFGAKHGISFTVSFTADTAQLPAQMQKFC